MEITRHAFLHRVLREFNAACMSVDQIVDIRSTFRYLGVPIDVIAYMLGDNQSGVTNAT